MNTLLSILPDCLSDVSITTTTVPTVRDDATAGGVLWHVSAGRFLLTMPGVAQYQVESGRQITINPITDADPMAVEHFLRMTPLAALLYQRGVVAFHAAVVANEDGAILLAGDSGVGKSTLLAVLLQQGWTMLADDLAIVELDEQGQAIVHPTFPGIALWPDTLTKLDIDSNALQYCDANRQLFLLPEQFNHISKPLRAIYWLDIYGKDDVELVELGGSARFRAIGSLMYNSTIADALLNRAAYMRCVGAISQSIKISKLRRPREKWSVETLADKISLFS